MRCPIFDHFFTAAAAASLKPSVCMLEVTFPPTQTHGWPPFCSWPQGGSSGVIIALQMAYIRGKRVSIF